ncbi:piggyBac transposable element-derived protein 4-like [Pectinophora gossypiella]|uniref:piggyBac transposable element-derived protein 4-like n=1 Tax=Pectinophora gossypiella TaxID=13191 RepID=UPI00214EB2F5|nr:piggyBac transposable element-derived protein 4-like [Pectinophora gossypiella]
MQIFMGLLFHMGHIRLPRINDYWRRDILFNFSFRRFMSRDRFLLILRNLCFSSPGNISQNSIIRHTKPIIDFFNNLMATLVTPGRNLTIDETLVLWRGRLSIKQHIKGKRHKFGIKLYVLADSKGTCQKIIMYTGAADPAVGGSGHTDKVVKSLMEKYFDQGYSLYMDNFYNSVGLAEYLLARKTYCTGTLRARRLRNPPHIKARVARGSCLYKFNRRGVCVANFKDKRTVLSISTQYSGSLVETSNRRGNVVRKPEMVVHYNRNMKGVDFKDQLLSYYTCYPKTMRWYKKIVVHIFQVMVLNAFLTYKINNLSATFYSFRIDIVRRL